MFLSEIEQKTNKEYIQNGYIIRPVDDLSSLIWIREKIIEYIIKSNIVMHEKDCILNYMHDGVPLSNLNNLRLGIINAINSEPLFRENYFKIAKTYLEMLVGNELVMQNRVNLSIQYPGDNSSLLQLHADTWSGDSPYEVVVWLPLVDAYKTKSMYILPPQYLSEIHEIMKNNKAWSSEDIYKLVEKDVKFLTVNFGEVLIFNQTLPHGNRINEEIQTRWSLNCRFKGVFTPYGDKKLGEFFQPITLRAASVTGMNYSQPSVS